MTPPMPAEQVTADASSPAPTPALSGDDLLLWSALPDLTLNIAQTAALCGVSVRQLGYWTKQGYVIATGRGARRLYGPEALRRILAIRQSMHDGLSLRQSLRALEAPPHGSPMASAVMPDEAAASPTAFPPVANGEAVTADLLALFAQNHRTRDSAGGLSIKIGRAEGDVRQAAERLAARSILHKTFIGSDPVYAFSGGKAP